MTWSVCFYATKATYTHIQYTHTLLFTKSISFSPWIKANLFSLSHLSAHLNRIFFHNFGHFFIKKQWHLLLRRAASCPHHPSPSEPLPLIDNECVSGCLAGRSYLLSSAVSVHFVAGETGRGSASPQETAADSECSLIIALLTSPHIYTYLGCLRSPVGQLTDSRIRLLPLNEQWTLSQGRADKPWGGKREDEETAWL